MLRITLDVFSGRPNPTVVVDAEEARGILRDISRNRGAVTALDSGYSGLGFRGIVLESTEDSGFDRYELPAAFKLAGGSSSNEAKAEELAARLIRRVTEVGPADAMAFPAEFDRMLLRMLETRHIFEHYSEAESHVPSLPPKAAGAACTIELGKFNPGFWNDPSHIGRNNCYNYASNKRTDTFAQPGRGSGHQYTALTCAAVTAAAMSDGLHHRFDCFPDAVKPRWLVALVVAPGYDYHWYRKQLEGFWGHKPGGTPARNVDNNGAVVMSPEMCARQPYTDFCGYFYVPSNQRIS